MLSEKELFNLYTCLNKEEKKVFERILVSFSKDTEKEKEKEKEKETKVTETNLNEMKMPQLRAKISQFGHIPDDYLVNISGHIERRKVLSEVCEKLFNKYLELLGQSTKKLQKLVRASSAQAAIDKSMTDEERKEAYALALISQYKIKKK